ncbi:MAG: tRNA (5-methylaminomethyl-2-thiouridine)(34)-methyltransferase MnmD [Bacteroidales bacterium]|nr:tRNA (5-methylaminomethyl-2-thiouridine)(34)-methyltransferase MnmD [Bacteroidales bacterium]
MKLSIEETQDGWATLYLPEQNEHYHSMFGAFEEAQWIYIERGFDAVQAVLPADAPLRILEMGFGTGLNAVLTVRAAVRAKRQVLYTGVEAYPLSAEIVSTLGYAARLGDEAVCYGALHDLPWSAWRPSLPFTAVTPCFQARKVKGLFQDIDWPDRIFDLVYYDAFSPRVQPELWTEEVARRLYAALVPGGRLVTYCAQGRWKKNLQAAGFILTMLPGPGGKREITSAEKLV